MEKQAFYGILTSPKTSEKDCPIQPHELVSFPSDSSSNAEIVALESGYETKPQTGSEPARYEVDPSLIMNEYSVNQNNWEKIREILPYVLRKGMSFDKGVWSFICDPTSYMYIRDIDVPLRIAGAPVIVLVYSPSFEIPDTSALVPDPYTSEIDPCDEIPAGFICCLFNTYPFALYFYVFCSGHLQIGVDSPFDYLTSSTKYPRTFGGFKVSFFTNGPVATSNSGPSAARRTSGISLRRGGEVEIGDSSHGHQTTRFRAGLAVKMDGDGIRRKDGTDGGGCFITIPTHGAIAPAKVAGHGPISRIISRLFSGLRRGPLQLIGTVVYGTAQGGLGDRTRVGFRPNARASSGLADQCRLVLSKIHLIQSRALAHRTTSSLESFLAISSMTYLWSGQIILISAKTST